MYGGFEEIRQEAKQLKCSEARDPLNTRRHIAMWVLFLVWFLPSLPSLGQEAYKKAIENELLSKARSNIEKYRKGGALLTVLTAQGEPLKNVNIEINQVTQDFLFGNLSEEVFRSGLTQSEKDKFTEMFKGLFNFTELTVKWSPFEPQQGKPEWEKLQQKLDWCASNGIVPKGHTLGWTHDAGTPGWLYQYSPESATQLYKARIQNLVGGFRDQIHSWDVVNEPVTTIPWELAMKDTVGGQNKIDDGFRYQVGFRGFYGTYELILTDTKGKVSTKKIHLKEGDENRFEFVLEDLNPKR